MIFVNKINTTTSVFFLLLLLVFSCSPSAEQVGRQDAGEIITDTMIGQMIMIGFRGKSIDEVSPVIKEQIQKGQAGSIVLFDYDVVNKEFDRNIESPGQVRQLVADIQELAPQPLIVAVDQEGGRVNRLKPRYGFPGLPSAQHLGELNNPDSTAYYARLNAENLQSLGFNVNFAPVVDLNVNPGNPVIGGIERSFSADPETVIRHARTWISVHDSLGVASVLKHFPGHGSSTSDSHEGFTDVSNTWQPVELEPYRQLLQTDAAVSVMTAHVYNNRIDSLYPATLSPHYINGLLRDSIGFGGVVFSDDLNMKAVHGLFGFDTIILKSIEAGVDVLTFGNNLEYDESIAPKAIQTIRRLLDEGKISPERIRTSYDRITALKAKLGGER